MPFSRLLSPVPCEWQERDAGTFIIDTRMLTQCTSYSSDDYFILHPSTNIYRSLVKNKLKGSKHLRESSAICAYQQSALNTNHKF
jgi:hypothetical protein